MFICRYETRSFSIFIESYMEKYSIQTLGRNVQLSLITQLLNFTLKLFRVPTFEELIKRLLKIIFWVLLLIPLVLLPLYFLVFSALGLH